MESPTEGAEQVRLSGQLFAEDQNAPPAHVTWAAGASQHKRSLPRSPVARLVQAGPWSGGTYREMP